MSTQRKISGVSISGVVLLAIGIALLLDNLNLIYFDLGNFLRDWWPAIFILIGLNELIKANHSGGWFFIGLGVIFLLKINDVIGGALLIALLLILVGIGLIIRPRKFDWQTTIGTSRTKTTDSDTIKLEAVFSDFTENVVSDKFGGGKVETVFGKMTVDLRSAQMQTGRCHLHIETIFGRTALIVPKGIRIEISGGPVFGRIDNQIEAVASAESEIILEIKAEVVFGILEIRN